MLFCYFTIYGGFIFNVALTENTTTVDSNGVAVSNISGPLKQVSPLTSPVNVLLLCGDQSSGNTDTIMVFNFDPKTCDIRLISIPRDTAVYLNGRLSKINAAYPLGGMEYAAETLSDVLGCGIDYHAYIDTSLFRDVIDILGGVQVDIPVDMNYDDKSQNLHIHFKKGPKLLNGKEAEAFCRYRKPNNGAYTPELMQYYDGGDINRIEAQQYFISQLIDQKANVKYVSMANSILERVFATVKTNMSKDTALRLLYNVGENLSIDSFKQYRLSGHTNTINGVSYFCYNGELYDNTKQKQITRSEFMSKHFNTEGKFIQLNSVSSLNQISSMKAVSGLTHIISGGGYSYRSKKAKK